VLIYLPERDVSYRIHHIPFKHCHATLLQARAGRPPDLLRRRDLAFNWHSAASEHIGHATSVGRRAVNRRTHLFRIQHLRRRHQLSLFLGHNRPLLLPLPPPHEARSLNQLETL